MIRAAYSRRGMTLAELMVAMGMVAIMIVMIVSFTMLMTGHTQGNGERLAFQQDFAVVKAQVESWMELNQASIQNWDEKSVTAGDSTLKFEYKVLTAGDNTYRAENITAVTFELVPNEDTTEYLLFCAVKGVNGENYTFCVNPRVGETVEVSNEENP